MSATTKVAGPAQATLSKNSLTLTPYDGVSTDGLVAFDTNEYTAGGIRYVLTFEVLPRLISAWTDAVLVDGTPIQVRSADCGLDCRCAGEFRWPTN